MNNTTLRNVIPNFCRDLPSGVPLCDDATHVPVQLRSRQRIFGEFVDARVQPVLDIGELLTHLVRPLPLGSDVIRGILKVVNNLARGA